MNGQVLRLTVKLFAVVHCVFSQLTRYALAAKAGVTGLGWTATGSMATIKTHQELYQIRGFKLGATQHTRSPSPGGDLLTAGCDVGEGVFSKSQTSHDGSCNTQFQPLSTAWKP